MLFKISAVLAGSGSSRLTMLVAIGAGMREVIEEGEQILDAIRNDTVG